MKSGEAVDKNRIPIYPGDLLRTYHFTGARRKKHFLYHVAVLKDGVMYAVPTSHLEPTQVSGGGKCRISDLIARGFEIISGHGPGDILSFYERPKQ